MTDMTDNEIIKALECCLDAVDEGDTKTFDFLGAVIDLLSRQKAEIEKMKLDDECFVTQIKDAYMQIDVLNRKLSTAKSEAIKEFAEKLKDCIRLEDDCDYDCEQCYHECEKEVTIIDNLAKEMTKEQSI